MRCFSPRPRTRTTCGAAKRNARARRRRAGPATRHRPPRTRAWPLSHAATAKPAHQELEGAPLVNLDGRQPLAHPVLRRRRHRRLPALLGSPLQLRLLLQQLHGATVERVDGARGRLLAQRRHAKRRPAASRRAAAARGAPVRRLQQVPSARPRQRGAVRRRRRRRRAARLGGALVQQHLAGQQAAQPRQRAHALHQARAVRRLRARHLRAPPSRRHASRHTYRACGGGAGARQDTSRRKDDSAPLARTCMFHPAPPPALR